MGQRESGELPRPNKELIFAPHDHWRIDALMKVVNATHLASPSIFFISPREDAHTQKQLTVIVRPKVPDEEIWRKLVDLHDHLQAMYTIFLEEYENTSLPPIMAQLQATDNLLQYAVGTYGNGNH